MALKDLSIKNLVGVHLFQLGYLGLLALLPFIVAKPVIGFTILATLTLVAAVTMVNNLTFRKVPTDNKSVLITGCDSGFGHALAKRLSSQGLMVFAGCLYPEGEGASTLCKTEHSHNIQVVPLDITSDQSVTDAIQLMKKHPRFKGLWSLVNNAGVSRVADVEFCSLDMYKEVADVNIMGTIRITKMCIPLLRSQKGRIVMIGSTDMGYPSQSAHAMSKGAVTWFTNSLRLEMRKFGVKVITVQPGNFYGATGMLNKAALSKVETSLENLYDDSTLDVKHAYSRQYLQSMYMNAKQFATTTCNTLGPVIDQLEMAIISTKPKIIYLVDGSQYIDVHNWLSRLQMVLPVWVIDAYLERQLCVNNQVDSIHR